MRLHYDLFRTIYLGLDLFPDLIFPLVTLLDFAGSAV